RLRRERKRRKQAFSRAFVHLSSPTIGGSKRKAGTSLYQHCRSGSTSPRHCRGYPAPHHYDSHHCPARTSQRDPSGAYRESRARGPQNAGHHRVRLRLFAAASQSISLAATVSYAMYAPLVPSYYLERVAATMLVREGAPLRELAERIHTPLFTPGGAFSEL